MIYLDAAATTPVRREVVDALWPYLTANFGNPSSHHSLGEPAAAALNEARSAIADFFDCRPSEIIFTSGGTEANNLAIRGIALANLRGRHLVTSRIEHESVLASCDYLRRHHGFEIDYVETDSSGLITPDDLEKVLRPDTTLVSIAHANNEIGTVQPITELTEVARTAHTPFHTDAVQSAGWLDVRQSTLGVDAVSISGHKLGAPKGIGVLFARSRIPLEPLIHGGGQERGHRSGTENVASSVGLAAAVRLLDRNLGDRAARVGEQRDIFIAAVLRDVPDAALTGHSVQRLPASASFLFAGTSGEAVVIELDARGIICSSGSACAAGSDEPSHVLTALGVPAQRAQTAVRFTWDDTVTSEQLETVASSIVDAVAAVRGIRR